MAKRNILNQGGIVLFTLLLCITAAVPAMSYEEPNFTIIKKIMSMKSDAMRKEQ